MDNRVLCVTLLGLALLGCQKQAQDCANTFELERKAALPTATEVFDLRTKCAVLGDKILNDNVIGTALAQEVISHYNPDTNRCYVELDVHTADLSNPRYELTKFLYDGQTKELLATLNTAGVDKLSGMIFDPTHKSTNSTNAGFDDADNYISSKMNDERKE